MDNSLGSETDPSLVLRLSSILSPTGIDPPGSSTVGPISTSSLPCIKLLINLAENHQKWSLNH